MMADYVKFFATRLVLGTIEVKVNVPDIAIIAKGEGEQPFRICVDGLDCLGVTLAQFVCIVVAFKDWACWVDSHDTLHGRTSSIPGAIFVLYISYHGRTLNSTCVPVILSCKATYLPSKTVSDAECFKVPIYVGFHLESQTGHEMADHHGGSRCPKPSVL